MQRGIGGVAVSACRMREYLRSFIDDLAKPRRPWGRGEFSGTPEQVEKLERYLEEHRMMSPDSVAMHAGTPVYLNLDDE